MVEIITIRDGEIIMNRTEILSIKELKTIMTRINPMKGDSDGRKKRLNTLEMQFIKYYADPRLHSSSIYAAYSNEERIPKIKFDIGLPDDWKPDEAVFAACDKYKEIILNYVPSARALNSFQKSLMLIGDSNDVTIDKINTILAELKKINSSVKKEDGTIDTTSLAIVDEMLNNLQSSVSNIVKLARELPALLSTIDELRKQVLKEEGQFRKRGGGQIYNRETIK